MTRTRFAFGFQDLVEDAPLDNLGAGGVVEEHLHGHAEVAGKLEVESALGDTAGATEGAVFTETKEPFPNRPSALSSRPHAFRHLMLRYPMTAPDLEYSISTSALVNAGS